MWKLVESVFSQKPVEWGNRGTAIQLQFQQTALEIFCSQKLLYLVVVMSDVERWKASQAATIKSLTSKLACGIFVATVEIHSAAPGSRPQ
jgi:hypothetical protein